MDRDKSIRVVSSCENVETYFTTDLISGIAPTDYGQNNASLFKLARLVKSYEDEIDRAATEWELEFVFDRWCSVANGFWRSGLTRDDYYAEFLEVYSYARHGLKIELAVSRAKAAPLPEVRGFTDERIRLLVAICREMHEVTGTDPFFLPTRKLGQILGVHYSKIARWLRAIEALRIIHLAPGEVRQRGGSRSPRYHCDVSLPSARRSGQRETANALQTEGHQWRERLQLSNGIHNHGGGSCECALTQAAKESQ